MLTTEFINEITEDGIIDASKAEKIKSIIYEDGIIDRAEADALFEIADKTVGGAYDPAWMNLYVEAITDHVLKDDTSPGVVDDDEAKWLIDSIGADGICTPMEISLLAKVIGDSTSCPDNLIDYTLEKLMAQVVEDGIVDDGEVSLIKQVIYGEGGASGGKVDEKEADFIYAINDETTGNANCDDWQVLFVESLSSYYLEDDTSPGVIDEDEANHIISKCQGDGGLDGNEIALLKNLKDKATEIHESLNTLIEMAM